MKLKKLLLQIQQVVLAVLILLLATAGYRTLSFRVSEVAENFRNRLIAELEEQYSIRIEYAGMSPSLLISIKMDDLRIYAMGVEEPFLVIDKLKIYHNLFGLLFTRETILSSITAQGVHLDLDAQRDRDIFESLSGTGNGGNRITLDTLFKEFIRIRNWDFKYKSGDAVFLAEGNIISLQQTGDFLRVNLKGALGYNNTGSQVQLNSLSFESNIKGTVRNDFASFSLDSDFHNIDTNLAVLEDQRVNLSLQDESFRITKIKDDKPYDLNLLLDRDVIRLSLIAEEFYPSSLVHFKSGLEQINPWLNTSLSGEGEFRLERGTGIFNYAYKGDASLSNESLPFPVSLSLDVNGDDLQIRSDEFRLRTRYGDYNWTGQWVYRNGLPEGRIFLRNIPAGGNNRLQGSLTLRNIDDFYSIRSDSLVLNGTGNAGDLMILVNGEGRHYLFSLQSTLNPENEWDDRLTVDGEIDFGEGLLLKSNYRIGEMSLDSLSTIIGFPVLDNLNQKLPGIVMQSEGSITLDEDRISLQVNRLDTRLPGDNNRLSLSGYFGNDYLEIYNIDMQWGMNSLRGSGTAGFSDSRITMNSALNINDIKYELDGLYSSGQISVKSGNGLKFQLLKSGQSSYLGTLEAEKLPLSWSGNNFDATLNLKGRYIKNDWELFLSDSSLAWKNSGILMNPEVSMTLFVAPGVVNIFSMGYKDDFSTLSGNGSLFYDLNNKIYNGSLVLKEESSESNIESYDAYAAYNNGSLSMTVQINQGLLDRFAGLGMKGHVDSVLNFDGTLKTPVLAGSLSAPDLEWNNNPFGINGRIRLKNRSLDVYELNIRRNNLYLSRGLGVFDLKEGDLVFTAAVSNVSPDKKENTLTARIETGFTVEAKTGLSIDFGNPGLPELRDFNGRLRLHPVKWNGTTTFASKTLDFSKKGSEFRTELLSDPEQMIYYNTESKEIRAVLKREFPVSMNLSGSLDPDNLSLRADNLVLDLNLINYVMPKDPSLDSRFVVFRNGSEMTGNMKISGTLKDPDFSGRLQSRNLRVLTPYTTAEIKETSLVATVVDDVVTTNEFYIPVGNSGGVRAQGSMTMRGWGIRDYNLDIAVVGTPGAPITYNANGLSGAGAATASLRLFGDSNLGNFEGRVVVEELVGSLGEQTDRDLIVRRGSSYPFRLNLQIVTGKNVLIILPNPQVEIVRAAAEPGEVINLTIDSRNESLSMTGGVSIRDGEIYYFDRTFKMTEGSITFNEDQDTFNPFLNVEAEIDTTDQNGDNVTIYLVYRNPIMDEFLPSFRSNPSMPEDQIVALFGQSLIPYDETGQADISRLVLATGGMVSQYGFVKPLELALKDSLRLDNVTIKTEILENALIDQFNRDESVAQTGSVFSMARYLDNTSLYLGKFVSDSLYFSAGIVVDYDQLYGLRSYLNGVKFVPDLTIEMRTPFFLVFWNYNNRNAFDLHNTDFMRNNAIGLEWRYSY